MVACLEIVSPGFQSAIQDMGRWGYQELGVPICGTVAPHWLELGNFLVGNSPDAPVIEFRALGPTLRAEEKPVKVAVCASVKLEVTIKSDAGSQTRKLAGWRSFTLKPGEELKVGATEASAVGVIALSGGIAVEPVLGSVATYARSAIGGLKGRMLEAGDRVALGARAAELANEPDKVLPSPPTTQGGCVRVVLGPQNDYFTQQALNDFVTSDFTVSKASDRMGARLEGPVLKHRPDKGAEIVSDGVVPGAIQVPGNGSPIVLLNDGQTVGGYPKIATIISSDLHLVANALPGKIIRFTEVSAHEACEIARQEHHGLERLKNSVVSASANGFVNLKALYEENLLSGVVDMSCPDHFPGHLEG